MIYDNLVFAGVGAAPGTGGSTTDRPGDTGDVEALERFVRALEESTDVDAVAALYAEDALLLGPYTPGLYDGRPAIRAYLETRLSPLSSRTIDALDVNVASNGNLAAVHGQQRISETSRDGSVRTTLTRFHTVVRRDGDGWLVVVSHVSFYVDFATMGIWDGGGFLQPGVLHWDTDPFPEPAVSLDAAKEELDVWQCDDIRAQCAEQAMHCYGPGDYLTVYDSRYPVGRMVGMWGTFRGWLPQMQLKHVEETLVDFRVWSDGQFAANFTHGEVDATKLDNSEMHSRFRQLDCLHRLDGQWYSFVESVSFPVEEDTGRPVINLKAQPT